MKNILEAASPGHNLDHEIKLKVLHEHFYDNALYHAACMTNYKVRNLSNNVDIRRALRFTIRSELISDTNLRNAVSWSEVIDETVSKQKNTDSAYMNSTAASSVITTRSDWQSCIFCTNKT
jgi:hypothetical protein